MQIPSILAGGVLLLAGRRLFWLFVGVIGFFAGMSLAGRFFSEDAALIAGVVLGVVAALLAVSLSRFGLAVVGFLAGGYFLTNVIGMFSANGEGFYWLLFVIGGILGAALLSLVFDWALIALSALVGALLVTRGLGVEAPLSLLALVVLVVIGIIVQSRTRSA